MFCSSRTNLLNNSNKNPEGILPQQIDQMLQMLKKSTLQILLRMFQLQVRPHNVQQLFHAAKANRTYPAHGVARPKESWLEIKDNKLIPRNQSIMFYL